MMNIINAIINYVMNPPALVLYASAITLAIGGITIIYIIYKKR